MTWVAPPHPPSHRAGAWDVEASTTAAKRVRSLTFPPLTTMTALHSGPCHQGKSNSLVT
jgi:hypothetical protein